LKTQKNKWERTIVVDLTPILPGGENGGAKIFVLELLKRLALLQPKARFILLTQAAAHDELASMEYPNMQRCLRVAKTSFSKKLRTLLFTCAIKILPYFPNRLRHIIVRLGALCNSALKKHEPLTTLDDIEIDLLFCPFTAPTYAKPGIPTVCTLYDLQYKTYPEFFSPMDVAHRHQTFIQACKEATLLSAISDYSRHSAITHSNLDPKHIRTIYLRMAQRIIPENAHNDQLLTELKLKPQQYLLYPANFWKHKNHEMLLTAFNVAHHNGLESHIKLVCTGAPGERQKWLKYATKMLKLQDRILFPGYLSNTDLATLMANCSGMIFPSLYEGFGLPVIEAMAAGIPVACSNISSLPEVAQNAAILFNPKLPNEIADAMITLTQDKSKVLELIQMGTERAQTFSDANRMAEEYWQLFNDAWNPA
jgi:glycosyltransferase involved in cell wall biosynthesis